MTQEGKLQCAANYIRKRGVKDEDLKQEIYLAALETDIGGIRNPSAKLIRAFDKALEKSEKRSDLSLNREDVLDEAICISLEKMFNNIERDDIVKIVRECQEGFELDNWKFGIDILLYRYGFIDGNTHSLYECPEYFNKKLTVTRYFQLEMKALKKLRYIFICSKKLKYSDF